MDRLRVRMIEQVDCLAKDEHYNLPEEKAHELHAAGKLHIVDHAQPGPTEKKPAGPSETKPARAPKKKTAAPAPQRSEENQ